MIDLSPIQRPSLKLVRMLLACLLLVVGVASSGHADTTYNYTSNPYTFCVGTYANGVNNVCSAPVALSITFDTTLSGTQLDNLVVNASQDAASAHCSNCVGIGPIAGNLTGSISSFSIADGSGFSITQADTADYGFDVTTDGNGNIQSWFIFAQSYPASGTGSFFQALTENGLGLGPLADGSLLQSYDGTAAGTDLNGNFTEVGGGFTDFTDRISSPSQWTVPEPSSLQLLGTGALALIGMGFRRKQLG